MRPAGITVPTRAVIHMLYSQMMFEMNTIVPPPVETVYVPDATALSVMPLL